MKINCEFIIFRKYSRARRDDPFDGFKTTPDNYVDIHIEGLRIDTADKEPSHDEDGIPRVLAGTKAVIRLFGTGITKDTLITFTDVPAERGVVCDKIKSNEFPVSYRRTVRTKDGPREIVKRRFSMFEGGKRSGNYGDRSRGTSSGIVVLRVCETAVVREGEVDKERRAVQAPRHRAVQHREHIFSF